MAQICEHHGTIRAISGRPTVLVSFSGIDGAGKTTQIDALLAWMCDAGLRARLVRFWDDIAVAGRVREALTHTLFKSEKGVGAPDKPVQRRDKNVRAWYMTSARLFLYFLDAVRLAVVAATASRMDVDVVVFDRYIYDELANLDLGSPLARAYARLLLKLVPRPDVAFLLDADPAEARARKPEYPLSFVHANRARYMALCKLAGGITVLRPAAVNDLTRHVLDGVSTALLRVGLRASSTGSPLFTAECHQ